MNLTSISAFLKEHWAAFLGLLAAIVAVFLMASCGDKPQPVAQAAPIVQQAPQPQVIQAAPAAAPGVVVVQQPAPTQAGNDGFVQGALMGGLLGHAIGSGGGGRGVVQAAPSTTVINKTVVNRTIVNQPAPVRPAAAPMTRMPSPPTMTRSFSSTSSFRSSGRR